MTFAFSGKPVAYMPYAEMKRAMDQEVQMQNAVARSASPYRLSPREVSKASPQPDMNAARYSVPPGSFSQPTCFPRACWEIVAFLQPYLWLAEADPELGNPNVTLWGTILCLFS